MRLTLVLLTLNEIEGLSAIFPRLPLHAVDEAFAVDGGSTDGTLEFYAGRNFPVVQQRSKGRGEAFRLAFAQATGDALLFFSPDGNEAPEDIPKFRAFLEQGYDLVIASRMMRGARNEEDDHLFRWRKWANILFNQMANWTWNPGRRVTDCINGFRAMTRETWQEIALDGKGYTIEYQSTIRAFKCKKKIIEFPTHEGQRIGGSSGARAIPTGLRFLSLYLRECWVGRHWSTLQGE